MRYFIPLYALHVIIGTTRTTITSRIIIEFIGVKQGKFKGLEAEGDVM